MSKFQFRCSHPTLLLPRVARSHAGRLASSLAFAALFVILAGGATRAQAQNCDALVPSGGDDAPVINACLTNTGRAILTANANPFLIYSPIRAIQLPGRTLAGAGRDVTKIYPQFTCGDPRFVSGGAFLLPIEFRRSPNSVIRDFHLDLDQLRKDCGHGGNFAIDINKSEGSQVLNLKVTGSRYNDIGYTSGWANGSGIRVVNSANTTVSNNVLKDIGFAGGFAGGEGIAVDNSGSTRVQNNTVTRVAFGIVISNKGLSAGYTGDASGTTVTGNSVTGASQIGCPDCAQGRAVKLEACASDAPLMRNVTVTGNTATNYGGQIGGQSISANGQGGTGLMVLCGVQYSRFENNVFSNAPLALQGLFINSKDHLNQKKAMHHNTFNYNTFESGRGSGYCNGDCSDVEFGDEGPDQIGITRGSAGTNTLKALPCSYGFCIRVRFTRGCSQYSHAWFVYPPGQTFIFRGQSLTVAGAGVRPPDFFSVITFSFRNSSGVEVATFTTQRSLSNCVVNQQSVPISAAQFAPGIYTVYAKYYDGNAADVFIQDDPVGTLDVR